jgi:hypothetical protein
MADATKKVTNLNIDAVVESIHLGVRRAAVFLGLGLNAAAMPDFKKYQLAEITGLDFVPVQVSDDVVKEFKDEFAHWVLGNGLRELIESFAHALERLYEYCLMIEISRGKLLQGVAIKQFKDFKHAGLEDRLKKLSEDFHVVTDKATALVSISRARNCLVHRRGIVGEKEGTSGLNVSWWGFDIFGESPNGDVLEIPKPMPSDGIILNEGMALKIRHCERKRTFAFGSILRFKPVDVAEICQMVFLAGGDICKSFEEHCDGVGIRKITK